MSSEDVSETLSNWRDPFGKPPRLAQAAILNAVASLPRPLQMEERDIAIEILRTTLFWCVSIAARKSRKERGVGEEKIPPSIAERDWNALQTKLQGVVDTLSSIRKDELRFSDWCGAADQLTGNRDRIVPPHVAKDSVILPALPNGVEESTFAFFHMPQAFDQNMLSLQWVLEVTKCATFRAAQNKKAHGGKDADDRAYDCIRGLKRLYEKATGQRPTRPGHTRDKQKRTGAFLDFCAPLALAIDNRSRIAVASLIERSIWPEVAPYEGPP